MAEDTAEPMEARFLIDGREYDIPGLETFDMDEAMILYDYAGLTIEDFAADDEDDDEADVEERARKLKHPGLIRTLLHVAYQRGNPTLAKAKVGREIGKVNLFEILAALATEDDAGPPAETQSSTPSSNGSSDTSEQSSGLVSPTSSDEPDDGPPTTGTGVSDTSSPEPTVRTPEPSVLGTS